jgi:hypothetical protein
MSFLEKEEPSQSSFWDWVVGIGLVIVIGGFTVYYQYQKRSSLSRFKQADVYFQARNFKDAVKMYEELKSAQYLTTKNDSIIYARLDTVENIREQQVLFISQLRAKAKTGDSTVTSTALGGIAFPEFLPEEDKAWFDSVNQQGQALVKP